MGGKEKHMAVKIVRILLKVLKILFWYMLIFALVTPLLRPAGTGKEDGNHVLQATAGGERIRCIDDNEEALVRRLQIIHNARREIILSTFDFRIDNSGKQVLAALYGAARRGVQVRVLVDGISGIQLSRNEYFRAFAADEHVGAKVYSRINILMPWRFNYRLHDKYVIADNDVFLVGGRNTYDLFLGNYTKSSNQDRDILVYEGMAGSGETCLELLHDYFEKMWSSHNCSGCRRWIGEKTKEKNQRELLEIDSRQSEEIPELRQVPDWEHITMSTASLTLLVNPQRAFISEPTLWNNLCKYMEEGHDILIQTPYIICSSEMYDDFTDVCRHVHSVNIITNAVESGANPFGCTDYLNQKQRIIHCGTGVYEYLGEHSMHTKTVLIDDDTSIVGSFNMDERSAYLDTEMMIVIKGCPELNEELRQQSLEMEKSSMYVAPDGTETPGENYYPVTLSRGKQIFYAVLKVIIIPFRYLA